MSHEDNRRQAGDAEALYSWECSAEIGRWNPHLDSYEECGARGVVEIELNEDEPLGTMCTRCGSELGPESMERVE